MHCSILFKCFTQNCFLKFEISITRRFRVINYFVCSVWSNDLELWPRDLNVTLLVTAAVQNAYIKLNFMEHSVLDLRAILHLRQNADLWPISNTLQVYNIAYDEKHQNILRDRRTDDEFNLFIYLLRTSSAQCKTYNTHTNNTKNY